jgi:hypothetical protein
VEFGEALTFNQQVMGSSPIALTMEINRLVFGLGQPFLL